MGDAKIFLSVREGFTFWVASHKASPTEAAMNDKVIVLSSLTPVEEKTSLFLLEGEICPAFLVDNSNSCPLGAECRRYHRSQTEIINAVADFRSRCQENATFLTSRKYQPGVNPFRGSTGQIPQQHLPQMGQQPMYPPQGSMPPLSVGGVPPGMPPPPSQPPMMMYPGQGYAQPPPQHQQPQYPPQQGMRQPYGAAPRRAPIPGLQGEMVSSPEPLGDLPVQLDEDTIRKFMSPKFKAYVCCLPRTRQTVWLRDFEPRPQHYALLINLKLSTFFVARLDWKDIKTAKPVILFDKQICTHFVSHGNCTRINCGHTHRSLEQIKTLIACRHRQLKQMTSEQREQVLQQLLHDEAYVDGKLVVPDEPIASNIGKSGSIKLDKTLGVASESDSDSDDSQPIADTSSEYSSEHEGDTDSTKKRKREAKEAAAAKEKKKKDSGFSELKEDLIKKKPETRKRARSASSSGSSIKVADTSSEDSRDKRRRSRDRRDKEEKSRHRDTKDKEHRDKHRRHERSRDRSDRRR